MHLKNIKKDTRRCFFPDEGELQLFDYYTESNCKLECQWKKAEEVCGCKPWYIPAENGTTLCFILGNVCFQETMEKISRGEVNVSCDCAEDCVYSRYTIDLQDKTILERTSTSVWKHQFLGIDATAISTDEIEGPELKQKRWFNLGMLLVKTSKILHKNTDSLR